MAIATTILRPLARVAAMHAGRLAKAFVAAHRRTRQTQDELLAELLARHRQTAFGRDHGLGKVRTYEQFVRAVPLGGYETHRPYIRRVLEGETTALLPPDEQVLMFSLTSGTTGEPKHIPVTGRFAAEMRRGWNVFGIRLLQDHPAGFMRHILAIASPMREASSPTGLPCGAVSGLLRRHQKPIVRRMYAAPPAAAEIKDPHAKYYTLLRCGVGRDVGIITTANPSSTIKLAEAGQAEPERLIRDVRDGTITPPGEADAALLDAVRKARRFRPRPRLARRMEAGLSADGELLPRHYWRPPLLTNWTGGTLGLYLPRLRELFDGSPIRDIGLLASEGRFSVPLADGTPAGVAEITGNFLEFIPAAERDRERPVVLRAHELEEGEEYFLVFSNFTGLWRYNLDDRVRVTGKLGESPVFEFLCRGRQTVSITGEKVTEHQVVEAMRRAAAALGTAVDRFVIQGRFADTPYYELRVEADGVGRPAALAAGVDERLRELNIEYDAKRGSGRLGPIRPQVLEPGSFERAEREHLRRRGRQEQYKHQYLLTDVLNDKA